MFNKSKIEDSLYGIVGLRQPDNPDYQFLDAENQISRSGYYVNDNNYAKVELFKDNNDYHLASDTQLNTKLKELQQSAIASVCNKVFNKSDYIDRSLLYRYAQNKVNTETLPNGFIGYKLTLDSTKNIAFNISRIFLDFQGTGNIEILLFNSAKKQVLQSQIVSITTDRQEVELNWTVNNTDLDYKGEYYLGYNTDGLTVAPYKRDYNMSNVKSCYSNLDIQDIFVSGHNTNTIFDLTTVDGNSLSTGLNPDITVFDDYTDIIINNQSLFAYAIYLDMAIRMISLNLSSIRSNKNQRIGEQNTVRMIQEIEGQDGEGTVKITGLRPMLLSELKSLTQEINKLTTGYFGGQIMVDTLC